MKFLPLGIEWLKLQTPRCKLPPYRSILWNLALPEKKSILLVGKARALEHRQPKHRNRGYYYAKPTGQRSEGIPNENGMTFSD